MGKDSSEIRREIEETRARMGDTVEALGYKADIPARVKDNVNERVESVKGTIADVADSVKGTLADAAGSAKETLSGAGGKVGSALGDARRTLSQALIENTGKLQDATKDVRSNVQERLGNSVGSVADKLPRPDELTNVARRGAGIAAENPIGLALGALALGFLAGLIAPVSELEREKAGPLRDKLMERAKDVGADVLQQAQQAAVGAAQQVLGRNTLEPGAPGTASP